jgi:hypothetical protein
MGPAQAMDSQERKYRKRSIECDWATNLAWAS